MRNKRRFFRYIFTLLFAVSATAETQVSLTEVLSVIGSRQETNGLIDQTFSQIYYPEFNSHLVVLPVFDFSNDFQADSRIDAFVSVNTISGNPQVAIKEAFVDLLFSNIVRMKGGYLKNDLGYNSQFHPLTVIEMSPDFGQRFPEIVVGNDSQGTAGMPAASVAFNWTTFDQTWKWTWDNLYYFLSVDNARDNFILEKLSLSVDNWAFGAVYGFQPKAFDPQVSGYSPSVGGYCSFVTSVGFLFFWEGLYKRTSSKPFVDSTGPVSTRSNADFLNQSLRVEYSFVEPLAKNNMTLTGEYFYYGEGYNSDGFDRLVNAVKSNSVPLKHSNYFISQRTFQHYFEFGASYSVVSESIALSYSAVFEPQFWSSTHTVSLSKSFKDAGISGFVVFNPSSDERTLAGEGGRRLSYGINLSLEL